MTTSCPNRISTISVDAIAPVAGFGIEGILLVIPIAYLLLG
jgi:hypothetical protein